MHSTPPEIVRRDPAAQPIHVAFLILGASAILLLFLPFAWDVVPFADVFMDWQDLDPLWLISAPCIVLPIPVTVTYAVWRHRLPGSAMLAANALAALCVVGIVAGLRNVFTAGGPDAILLALSFGSAFGGVGLLVLRGIYPGHTAKPIVTMQAVYLIPMSFYLAGVGFELQIGGWLGVIASFTYLAQIALAVKNYWWVLALVMPLVGIISVTIYIGGF